MFSLNLIQIYLIILTTQIIFWIIIFCNFFYTPYEESLYGVINVYPDYRLCDCTTYVYRHVNGKIECSSFESDFSDDDLHAGYELAKYVNENLNNANTHILENNHLSILENRDNHVAYYIANENHNDFVSRTEFMATMNMSVTTE